MRFKEFKVGCTYESTDSEQKFRFKKISDDKILWLIRPKWLGDGMEEAISPDSGFGYTYRQVNKRRHRRHT